MKTNQIRIVMLMNGNHLKQALQVTIYPQASLIAIFSGTKI